MSRPSLVTARNEVWRLLVESYGLSYADVAVVCREVAQIADDGGRISN